jgi:hypothetical protein
MKFSLEIVAALEFNDDKILNLEFDHAAGVCLAEQMRSGFTNCRGISCPPSSQLSLVSPEESQFRYPSYTSRLWFKYQDLYFEPDAGSGKFAFHILDVEADSEASVDGWCVINLNEYGTNRLLQAIEVLLKYGPDHDHLWSDNWVGEGEGDLTLHRDHAGSTVCNELRLDYVE